MEFFLTENIHEKSERQTQEEIQEEIEQKISRLNSLVIDHDVEVPLSHESLVTIMADNDINNMEYESVVYLATNYLLNLYTNTDPDELLQRFRQDEEMEDECFDEYFEE